MISLSVLLREDLESSEVSASGFELVSLTDKAAKAFGLPGRQIVGKGKNWDVWDYIHAQLGRMPDEWITGDPVIGSSANNAPHRWNVYKDWDIAEHQVRVERKAVGCNLISVSGSIDAIDSTSVSNDNDHVQPGQGISMSYSESVEDGRSSENHWSMSLTNGMEITVGGEYAGMKAEAKRSIEFTVEAGGSKTTSHVRTVGKTIERHGNVDAQPFTEYPVSLTQGRGSLKVKVDYEYRLVGNFLAFFIQKAYQGKLASPLMDINHMLKSLNKPLVVRDSEILTPGFVTHGSIYIGKGKPLPGHPNYQE